MVKSRMTAIDICAMVHDISKDIKGQKLINIYDVNNRTYLFKFGGEEKKFLLVESGIRFHTTNWKRECEQRTSVSSISFFNNKLRRYLRNKRLVEILQMEMDRIVKLTFGFGENIFHLILEFFVAGNIILTDLNYNILVILRETSDLSIGKHYNFKSNDNSLPPTLSTSNSSFSRSESFNWLSRLKEKKYMIEELKKILHALEVDEDKCKDANSDAQSLKKKKNNGKNRNGITAVDVLCNLLKFFNLSAIEELLISEKINVDELFTDSSIEIYSDAFVNCVSRSLDVLEFLHKYTTKGLLIISLSSEEEMMENDVILNKPGGNITKDKTGKLYLSYTPYIDENEWISVPQTIPKEGLIIRRITSRFSEAVDEFYSSIDIERESKNVVQEQKVIYSKVDKVKIDQERRLNSLLFERESCIVCAKVMESHQELLDNIILLLRHLIATGAQWQDIWNEIQQQKKNNHPLAKYIKSIDLEHDKIRIYFSPEDLNFDTSSNIEQKKKGIEFDLFVSKSIQSNIRYKYNESKQLAKKHEKTKHAYKLALNKVSKIARKDAEKVSKGLSLTTPKIKRLRSSYWFEKFHWFISTDGFLVIGGQDASQNELLFRRYLEKNDRYIHADIHGAATCIVKNPNNFSEIPITTLNEAGQMSICYSKAWVNKAVISAWWVYPDQVSKTAPTGEYLSTGSFVIRGKKNFLAPLKLEMGCALYFLVKKVENKLYQGEKEVNIFSEKNSQNLNEVKSGDIGRINLEEINSLDHEDKKIHSNSTHVRFSVGDVSDVIPPLKIEHRVQFDELPPELLISKPFNPLSIDETSNQTSSVNSIENITNLASNIDINSDSSDESLERSIENSSKVELDNGTLEDNISENERKLSTLPVPKSSSRRSSVDEGPPPNGFSVSTLPTPAELLSHKVEFPTTMSSSSEEAIEYSNFNKSSKNEPTLNLSLKINVSKESDDWIKSLDSSPSHRTLSKTDSQTNSTDSHDVFNHKVRENYRRKSIDGGPTPRGFIPDHVPSARELLQKIRFDPVDLELEHLSHLRERGRFISDAVPYLPEELQRLIMLSNQNTNKKHRFTIDTNAGLISRVDLKNSPEFNVKTAMSNTHRSVKQESLDKKESRGIFVLNKNKADEVDTSNNTVNPNKISRRKRSKLKKVAIKYGEQDEDERKIKMMLSGSKEMKTLTSIYLENKDNKKGGSIIKEKSLHISIQEKKKKEQEKLGRIYKNRNVDNSIENREFQAIKDCMLTTNDSIDSELSAVIPIFAPYACIKNFKYCVKLTPGGSLKRSKAAQDIIHQFNTFSYKEKEHNPESYEYIKALKVDDIIKNIMNPVKISFSMGNKSDPQVDNKTRI
ncbi:hypothetical protein FG386_000874 [Cryptosporidium ryanae]|uniref:uncharacterized protein n=1 Tax=Cryptosporidium ryanae TaxID=515981 RepID=UPI00351A7E9F|nr:hypothetical protein FG386_000874 [Cryptosporidium ryanae]